MKGEVPCTLFPSFRVVVMQPVCQNGERAATFSSFRLHDPTHGPSRSENEGQLQIQARRK